MLWNVNSSAEADANLAGAASPQFTLRQPPSGVRVLGLELIYETVAA